jgi:hypothetical protein
MPIINPTLRWCAVFAAGGAALAVVRKIVL